MKHILVIGGAGFIGSNLSNHLLAKGYQVTVYDDLSRPGAEKNVEWLQAHHGSHLRLQKADIRDYEAVKQAVSDMDVIFDLAGQVAVTTSVADPRLDFEINALGTLNVLEAVRTINPEAIVVYTSTNKVYGKMANVPVIERDGCYDYENLPFGVSESQPLDFYSPYGCSKGAADQYVRDYTRIYGLRTVVFRMSCIYGIRQFGNEDQGWVAHFVISSVFGTALTIYGDGKQIRDILFIDDLIRAFGYAVENIYITQGQIYNIGGGRENTISLLELIEQLENLLGKRIEYSFDDWRPGDQKVYISDVRKAEQHFGWKPRISKEQGVRRLAEWVKDNKQLFN